MRIESRPYRVDRESYSRALMRRGLLRRILIVLGAILFFVAVLGFLFSWAALGVLPPLLLYVVVMVYVRWVMIRRQLFDIKNEPAFEERTTVFDDWGTHTRTESGATGEYPWKNMVKAERLESFTLLYQSTAVFSAVPDEAFAGEAELEAFHELLRANGLLRSKIRTAS